MRLDDFYEEKTEYKGVKLGAIKGGNGGGGRNRTGTECHRENDDCSWRKIYPLPPLLPPPLGIASLHGALTCDWRDRARSNRYQFAANENIVPTASLICKRFVRGRSS